MTDFYAPECASINQWREYRKTTPPRAEPLTGLLDPYFTVLCAKPGGAKTTVARTLLLGLVTGAGFGPFTPSADRHCVTYVGTDPGTTAKTGDWLAERLPKEFSDVAFVCRPPRGPDDEMGWGRLEAHLKSEASTLLIFDNLTGHLGGRKDINGSDAVAPTLERLTPISDAKCAVLLLAHLPKNIQNNQLLDATPLGSVTTEAVLRRRINIADPKEQIRRVRITPDDGPTADFRIQVWPEVEYMPPLADGSAGAGRGDQMQQPRHRRGRDDMRERRRKLLVDVSDVNEAGRALYAAGESKSVNAGRKWAETNAELLGLAG